MRHLETSIGINATPETVWAILDELSSYPEWNAMLPDIAGRTTVGGSVSTTFVRPNTPSMKISPRITRIVAGRELRWLTQAPDLTMFSAEHIFRIVPEADGTCTFHNDEIFSGSLVEERWLGLNTNTRQAFNEVNQKIKERAESRGEVPTLIHPSAQNATDGSNLIGEILSCGCEDHPVEVQLSENISHNHLCGCSKCWKPKGYLFAQTAVIPAGTAKVIANENKLEVVDPSQAIQRYSCKACGVHMIGRVNDPDHHFYGVDFVHPELAKGVQAERPKFAGFVSSVIETGTSPTLMSSIRSELEKAEIPPYDAFSPELMDIIAWHSVKSKSF